jgi:hypothetical protein
VNIFHLETKGQRRQHKPNLLKNSRLFSHLTQVIQMTSSTMLEMEDKKYQISQKIATVSTHATKKNKAQLAAPTLQASTLKATCCNYTVPQLFAAASVQYRTPLGVKARNNTTRHGTARHGRPVTILSNIIENTHSCRFVRSCITPWSMQKWKYKLHIFLTSAIDGGERVNFTTGSL